MASRGKKKEVKTPLQKFSALQWRWKLPLIFLAIDIPVVVFDWAESLEIIAHFPLSLLSLFWGMRYTYTVEEPGFFGTVIFYLPMFLNSFVIGFVVGGLIDRKKFAD